MGQETKFWAFASGPQQSFCIEWCLSSCVLGNVCVPGKQKFLSENNTIGRQTSLKNSLLSAMNLPLQRARKGVLGFVLGHPSLHEMIAEA